MNWVSVKERLPFKASPDVTFESVEVLVTDGKRVQVADFARGGGHIGDPWASWSQYSTIPAQWITHWMPLPEPPIMENDQGRV